MSVMPIARIDHHIVQRIQSFLNWRELIPTMDLVQVHVVRTEPLQAVIQLLEDRLA